MIAGRESLTVALFKDWPKPFSLLWRATRANFSPRSKKRVTEQRAAGAPRSWAKKQGKNCKKMSKTYKNTFFKQITHTFWKPSIRSRANLLKSQANHHDLFKETKSNSLMVALLSWATPSESLTVALFLRATRANRSHLLNNLSDFDQKSKEQIPNPSLSILLFDDSCIHYTVHYLFCRPLLLKLPWWDAQQSTTNRRKEQRSVFAIIEITAIQVHNTRNIQHSSVLAVIQ